MKTTNRYIDYLAWAVIAAMLAACFAGALSAFDRETQWEDDHRVIPPAVRDANRKERR